MKLEEGKTYQIDHSRKGKFRGKCLRFDDEWGTFRIVSGVAKHISEDDKTEGEIITVRLSFCDFKAITIPDSEEAK